MEKTNRLKKLNILLNMDEKDKTLIDSVPDEGEKAPEREDPYLRGHVDGFVYLKKIGVFKTEYP